MRAAGPVVPLKLPFVGRVWVTTTHAAALAMVKDNGLFVQEGRNAGKSGVAGFYWWMPKSLKALANNMLQKDEPDHRRLRKLVDPAFARRDILAMRPDRTGRRPDPRSLRGPGRRRPGQRIFPAPAAGGDLRPAGPARRDRDEFSALAHGRWASTARSAWSWRPARSARCSTTGAGRSRRRGAIRGPG